MAARKKPKPQKYDVVKVSNDLIEAFVRQNNLVAMKILFYVARADLELPQTNRQMVSLTLDKQRLCEYCGIATPTLHAYVRRMVETSISIKSEEGTAYMSVIPRAFFADGRAELRIEVFREVLELIWQVRNRFTVIDVDQLMKLSSKHSVRMLQLLEMVAGFDDGVAKRKRYFLEDLNSMFGTKYSRMAEFERKILQPVKEELDQNSRLSFAYQIEYKRGQGAGRPAAIGATIDLVQNSPQPSLF